MQRQEATPPEILSADLAPLALHLACSRCAPWVHLADWPNAAQQCDCDLLFQMLVATHACPTSHSSKPTERTEA